MKIGIPKSLLYYYYYPFWQTLFSMLGSEIVLSDSTDTDLLNSGVKESISEICVPMKVYIGQVLNLVEKGVDLVYIPRFMSIRKNVTFCPKFLGLPDMIKNSLPTAKDKVLTHHINSNSDDISDYKNYAIFKKVFNITERKLKKALIAAREDWLEFRRLQKAGYKTEKLLEGIKEKRNESNLQIGVLGYVYNLYDNFINMDFLERLEEMGVKIITFDMLEEKTINDFVAGLRKPMFWEFTNKIMAAGYHFINSPKIDGIIHITAFGCGPDSMLGSFLEIDSENKQKPFMTLRIDEQTGESHLITRIEAFVDLLKLQKRREVI